MSRLKKGDINDLKYRRLLIVTFVRKIVLYIDKVIIYYNIKEEQSQYDFDCNSSSKDLLVEARGVEPLSEIGTLPFSTSVVYLYKFPI